MRTASPALTEFLRTADQVIVADLLTITLVTGVVIRLTNCDVDLTVGGYTYSHSSPLFTRGTTTVKVGLDVDTLPLTIMPAATDTIGGVPWCAAARIGVFDGARVRVDKVFMPTARDVSMGTLNLFEGRMAGTEIDRGMIRATIKSELELLNSVFPKNLYQPGCVHTLYDSGCALLRAAYQASGSVGAGSTTSILSVTGLSQGAGYYDLGSITFTSGVNSGLRRAVKSYTGGSVSLYVPLPSAPVAGDAFTIVAGCDKTQATCSAKFGNLVHFRGYPFIPPAETAR